MTFQEMPYERVDMAALCKVYEDLKARMEGAKTAEEAAALLDEHTRTYEPASTMMSLSSIRHTIDTEDPFYTAEEEFYAQEGPAFGEKVTDFYRAVLVSPFLKELRKEFPPVFFKNIQMDAKTISPAVLGELEEENKLVMDYQKLQGSAQIEFQGKVCNLSQLAVYKEDPRREVRKGAYTAEGNFYREHKAEYDRIYDELVKKRTAIAKKLGFQNFVELADSLGFRILGLTFSPVKGPEGNIEFLAHLSLQPGEDAYPLPGDLVAQAHTALKG